MLKQNNANIITNIAKATHSINQAKNTKETKDFKNLLLRPYRPWQPLFELQKAENLFR